MVTEVSAEQLTLIVWAKPVASLNRGGMKKEGIGSLHLMWDRLPSVSQLQKQPVRLNCYFIQYFMVLRVQTGACFKKMLIEQTT